MRVFLSHAHRDREIADAVRAELLRSGFDVWADQSVLPGESLAARISEALRAADAFVVLIGSDTARRQWSALEISGALASGKPLIPALVARDAELPLMLRDRLYIDLTRPETRQQELTRLPDALTESSEIRPSELADGANLVRAASATLEQQIATYEMIRSAHRSRVVQVQATFALAAMVTTLVALVVAAREVSSITIALTAGAASLLTSTIGFYLGSRKRGPHK